MTGLQEETFNFIFRGSKSNVHFYLFIYFILQPGLGVSDAPSSLRVHSLRLWLLTTPTFPVVSPRLTLSTFLL